MKERVCAPRFRSTPLRWRARARARDERRTEARDPTVRGRGRPAPRPHGPVPLQQQGDLPPRAHLQRLGRGRPAALRGPLRRIPRHGRRRAPDLHPLRPRGAHPDRRRQRHRHVAGRGGREHRDHRALRNPPLHRVAHRGRGEGRGAHRAVRGRLLFHLHRGRPGGAQLAPGGRARGRRGQVGVGRPRRVHRRDGGGAGPRDGGDAAPSRGEDELLDGYRLRGIVRKYSDHISFPIRMAKEGGAEDTDAEEGKETARRPGRSRARPRRRR